MDYRQTCTWKEINETNQTLKNILLNTGDAINETAKRIAKSGATNIVLTGRGTSNHALIFFKYLCEIYTGYTVSIAHPSTITRYNGKINFANSVVIGCSQSGQAKDCIEVLKRAKQDGGLTVAVTNDCNSPMATLCDHHLYCSAGKELSVAATKTFSAQLFVFALLVSRLANSNELYEQLLNISNSTQKVINNISCDSNILQTNFFNERGGFILSRGLTMPIALEGALKLQETCYLPIKGFASSDFYHGPMAMVGNDTPVQLYLAKHEGKLQERVRREQMENIKHLISLNAKLFIVTSDEVIANKFASNALTYLIKDCNGALSAVFAFALFAQIYACATSYHLGLNPDAPRALKKVTITL